MNVAVVAPIFYIHISLPADWFDRPGNPQVERRDKLFVRLATPVDVNRELAGSTDQTTRVFRFLSRATGAVGLLALLLLFTVHPSDRGCGACLLRNHARCCNCLDFRSRQGAGQDFLSGSRSQTELGTDFRAAECKLMKNNPVMKYILTNPTHWA